MKKKIAFLLAALMVFAVVPAISVQASEVKTYGTFGQPWPDKTLAFSATPATSLKNGADSIGIGDNNIKIADKEIKSITGGAILELKEVPKNVTSIKLSLNNGRFFYADADQSPAAKTSNVTDGLTFPTAPISDLYSYLVPSGVIAGPGTFTAATDTPELDGDGIYKTIYAVGYKVDGTLVNNQVAYRMQISNTEAVIKFDKLNITDTATSHFSVTIPISVYCEESSDIRVSVIDPSSSDGSPISGVGGSFTLSIKADSGTVQVTSEGKVTAKDSVMLKEVKLTENVRYTIKAGGTIKLTLSDGFSFRLTETVRDFVWSQRFAKDSGGTIKEKNLAADVDMWFNKDQKECIIKVPAIDPAVPGKQTYSMTGIWIESDDDNYEDCNLIVNGDFDSDITAVDARDRANNPKATGATGVKKAGIKETSVLVAGFADYGSKLTFDGSGAAVNGWSGQKELKLNKITFQEVVGKTWNLSRSVVFTMVDAEGNQLEGVKFASIAEKDPKEKDKATIDFKDLDNKKELEMALGGEQTNKALKISFEGKINISASFEGDVYLAANGRALTTDVEPLKIATIKKPIEITARKTSVPIGKQTYAVADIFVTEAAAGMIPAGDEITISLREFMDETSSRTTTQVEFNPIKASQVTVSEGNMTIKSVGSTKNDFSFTVKAASKTASTVKIEGLAVQITGAAPQGFYHLLMTDHDSKGDKIVNTYEPKWNDLSSKDKDKSPFFGVEGFGKLDYIEITNTTPNEILAKNILVAIGSDEAWIDGKAVTLSAPTFLETSSNRTMLPVRAIAEVFGIPADNILWNESRRTVTLFTLNNRTILFTIGSNVIEINGTKVDMDASAMISTGNDGGEAGRTYVPFRFLALAFGIEALWIPAAEAGELALVALNPTSEQRAQAEANANIAADPVTEPEEEEVAE